MSIARVVFSNYRDDVDIEIQNTSMVSFDEIRHWQLRIREKTYYREFRPNDDDEYGEWRCHPARVHVNGFGAGNLYNAGERALDVEIISATYLVHDYAFRIGAPGETQR